MNIIQRNPNASVALVSGAGGGPFFVWLLSLFHVDVDPLIGAMIAGLVAATVLWIGRDGLLGIGHTILHGKKGGEIVTAAKLNANIRDNFHGK